MTGIVAVFVVTAFVTYYLVRELRVANQNVSYDHAERVIDAHGIEIAMFARSASARGYLLSGDALFLENRKAARDRLGALLEDLRERHGDPAKLLAIEQLLGRLDAASDRAIATYSS